MINNTIMFTHRNTHMQRARAAAARRRCNQTRIQSTLLRPGLHCIAVETFESKTYRNCGSATDQRLDVFTVTHPHDSPTYPPIDHTSTLRSFHLFIIYGLFRIGVQNYPENRQWLTTKRLVDSGLIDFTSDDPPTTS